MKFLNTVWNILFIALLISIPVTILAEGDTPESTQEPEIVLVESNDFSVNIIQVTIGLLSATAIGGISGILGMAIFIDRIRNDVATVTALEKLAESYPASTRDLLLNISRTVDSIGELGKEIFDDVPIVNKTIVQPDGNPKS